MSVDFIHITLNLSLARGLNYYTGAIMEVVADNSKMGSICGGGRYDDLTELFGLDNVSGIGISFGIDRIYDIRKEQLHVDDRALILTKVVFVNFGQKEILGCMTAISKLRETGVSVVVYPEADKLKKQFRYADQLGASHVVTVGEQELVKGTYRLKDLRSGDQLDLNLEDLINHFHHEK
jgi:histidyl-tRNA synthetase